MTSEFLFHLAATTKGYQCFADSYEKAFEKVMMAMGHDPKDFKTRRKLKAYLPHDLKKEDYISYEVIL